MSLEKICANKYTDGIHKVKHKITGEESFVFVGESLIHADEFYMVLDCKTNRVISHDDYEHVEYYEDGMYFECEEHEGIWLFDDGYGYRDECLKCKSIEDEISRFKVGEDVYQYNSNREFQRLKFLFNADKFNFRKDDEKDLSKPKQGLFVVFFEHDQCGDEYYYYKTIEKGFIDALEWSDE